MPLWDFRAHATWRTCLSSYAFTFLADEPRLRSAGGLDPPMQGRLRRVLQVNVERFPLRFWQRRAGEAVRALTAALVNHFSQPLLFVESWMAPRRARFLRQPGPARRDVTAQVGPLIVLERAANLASRPQIKTGRAPIRRSPRLRINQARSQTIASQKSRCGSSPFHHIGNDKRASVHKPACTPGWSATRKLPVGKC